MAKFVSINRADGFVWLALDYSVLGNKKRLFIHKQGVIGGRIRPGLRIRGLHDSICATHRGYDCNCPSAVFRETEA